MQTHFPHRMPILISLSTLLLLGADWTRFRGPDATGVASDKDTPVTWSAKENVVWKTPLPGFGASSPITLGDKIFLTCYSGYGLDPDRPGEQSNLKLHLVCVSRADGKILWDKTQEARTPETEYRGFASLHGYASSTPTTDGQAVYAFFGRTGVVAYGLSGEPLWHNTVGDQTHAWGSAASPILWRNLLIVNASIESESLVALDKSNGKLAWRVEGIKESRSTPLVVDLPDGRQELVVSAHSKILGLDPATGQKLWQCTGVKDYVCPSVVAHEGIVFVTAGRKGQTLAIRAGGKGEVTKSHLVWELDKSPKVGTPSYYDGYLYWVSHQGVAVCVKADTGKVVYQQRLEIRGGGDKAYASLVAADGKLYAVTREDGALVLAAGPEFSELAHNRLGDKSIFNATPVIAEGRLLLRSDRHLYCIGK